MLLTTTDALRGIAHEAAADNAKRETLAPTAEWAVVRIGLEQRYGDDAGFVEQVLDKLAAQGKPQRKTILELLLNGIGDSLGRPARTRDLQLSR